MSKEGKIVIDKQLDLAKKRCRSVTQRIQKLPVSSNKITASSQRSLLKLVHSELTFLSRCSSLSNPPSVNIGHIEAVVHILQQPFITSVSCVYKPIPLLSTAKSAEKSSSSSKGVHVDIVCTLNRKPIWIIVSDRNPKYITWEKSHKNKGLKLRIEQVLVAAQSSVALKPSSVILFFSYGLDRLLYEKLRDEFGAAELGLEFSIFDFDFGEDLEGDWINVQARTYREACILEIKVNECGDAVSSSECGVKNLCLPAASQGLTENDTEKNVSDSFSSLISRMKLCSLEMRNSDTSNARNPLGEGDFINFDTTALIALISGISNGATEKILATPEVELRQRFKSNYEFVIGQVMSEIQNPIHVELGSVISGKTGIICQSVWSEFKELVLMCGGPNEKFHADQLLRHLMVVPDSPSERMMSLPTTRKLALKNKIVFGTGDYWHAPSLTANMAFVRAVSQTGMSLFTFEHRPRALTGD
ncbi:hypothetical protein UlMin_009037 [Ulmus minor]